MNTNRKACYAGSFDPPTKGHEWIIKTAAVMFDHLIVAVGVNPLKKPTFSLEERQIMLEKSCMNAVSDNSAVIHIRVFNNQFLVDFAKEVGAQFIVRGIRNESDYEGERTMRYLNADRCAEIQTVFLMPPRELVEVSSGAVKAMVGPKGWENFVQPYVSDYVFEKLKENYARKA